LQVRPADYFASADYTVGMKSPQPVQLGTIHMGMDIDSSNPQDNWILETRRINGEPNE
jgi:hypothetical protein